MQIYFYEPNDMKREAQLGELKAAGLTPCVIEDKFFEQDLRALNRDGCATRGFLISHSPRSKEFIKAIRDAGCKNPVLIARETRNSGSAADLINEGADDVIILPMKGVEVLARVNGINRRSHNHVDASVTIGEIVAYFDGRDPEVAGERMKLSQREHAIFSHLALNLGRVISKDSLYNAVYGMADNQPFDKVIDVYICKLRKKIEERTSGGPYIETVYGRGYKLSAPQVETAEVERTAARVETGNQAAGFVNA